MTGHEIGKQSDDDILYPHSLQCNKKGRICKASCCEYRVIDCHVTCVEELSKVCATTGVIVSAHTSLCIDPIMTFGTEEQKKKYVVPLAKGEKLGAFGLTEPGAGTDAQGCQTKAVLDGDEWVLNGSKCFITNGKVADVYIVIAITSITEDKRGRKKKNFSAFIVEKGAPGFSFGTKEKKMGWCKIIFQINSGCLTYGIFEYIIFLRILQTQIYRNRHRTLIMLISRR